MRGLVVKIAVLVISSSLGGWVQVASEPLPIGEIRGQAERLRSRSLVATMASGKIESIKNWVESVVYASMCVVAARIMEFV
jgi:hypothetical protein